MKLRIKYKIIPASTDTYGVIVWNDEPREFKIVKIYCFRVETEIDFPAGIEEYSTKMIPIGGLFLKGVEYDYNKFLCVGDIITCKKFISDKEKEVSPK